MSVLEHKYVPMIKTYIVKEKFLPYGEESVITPQKVVHLAKRILEGVDREYVMVLSLDTRDKPVALEIVSVGTIDAALVDGRGIFKHAILSNASGIIMIHNHPSGEVEPSREDILVTRKMKQAGEILGIELRDHIIIGDKESYFSMAENDELFNQ